MRHFSRFVGIACASSVSLIATGVAWAQAAAPAKQESPAADTAEIVVTATRQAEVLSKVPISVAAFSQKSLDTRGIRDITDVARITPGLRIEQGTRRGGGGTNVSIRGIDSSTGAATVGIYIDDTPIQTRTLGTWSQNGYPRIFDLERVEVLRGPQGTLFGAGSEGGAIRFITPKPSLSDYQIYGRAEASTIAHGGSSYEAGVAAGGPIVQDRLGFRISGWHRRDGGWVDRLSQTSNTVVSKDSNSSDSNSVRGAVTWAPFDNLSVTGAIYHQEVKENGLPEFWTSLSDRSAGVFQSRRKFDSTRDDKFTLSTISAEYDAGPITINSESSWFKRKTFLHFDFTTASSVSFIGPTTDVNNYLPNEYAGLYSRDRQNIFTQEVRFTSHFEGPFSFVVGAFYQKAKQDANGQQDDPFAEVAHLRERGQTLTQRFGVSIFCPPEEDIPGCGVQNVRNSSVDKQKAVFGEFYLEPLDGLKFTIGARYSDIETFNRRWTRGPTASIPAGAPLSSRNTVGVVAAAETREKPFTPKFGLSWQVDPDNLFYGTVSKGFRIGGLNSPVSATCAPELTLLGLPSSPTSYESDSVWSYELGAKNRLFGGKLRVDASVFRVDWSNIQRSISLLTCGNTQIVANLGSARSEGFDLAVELRPIDGLQIGGTVGYANARLTETVRGAPTTALPAGALFGSKGDKLGGSPWNYAVYGEYDFPVQGDTTAYVRGDWQHVGDTPRPNPGVTGVDPRRAVGEAYDTVSLRTGLRAGIVDASLFIDNLFDKAPLLYQTADSNASPLFFEGTIRPRTFGLTVTVRY